VHMYCVCVVIGSPLWVVVGGGYLCVQVLIKISNKGLCMFMNVLFICKPFLVMSYIWNLSNVLSLRPFFSICNILIICSIVL
jgi:hypothetical protein